MIEVGPLSHLQDTATLEDIKGSLKEDGKWLIELLVINFQQRIQQNNLMGKWMDIIYIFLAHKKLIYLVTFRSSY